MVEVAKRSAGGQRTASKEHRRQQLIKATIRSVAKRGFSETTMARVANEAGLSQGIINLHFQSKDRLLVETLRYLADEYRNAWERALERAGPTPAEKITALIDLDFSPSVCDRKKLAVWFAFWGEAKSRPTYLRLCEEYDREYDKVLIDLCRDIADEGSYQNVDPETVATALSALGDGLWLDLLITPGRLNREQARENCFSYLSSVFPTHFPRAPSA